MAGLIDDETYRSAAILPLESVFAVSLLIFLVDTSRIHEPLSPGNRFSSFDPLSEACLVDVLLSATSTCSKNFLAASTLLGFVLLSIRSLRSSIGGRGSCSEIIR